MIRKYDFNPRLPRFQTLLLMPFLHLTKWWINSMDNLITRYVFFAFGEVNKDWKWFNIYHEFSIAQLWPLSLQNRISASHGCIKITFHQYVSTDVIVSHHFEIGNLSCLIEKKAGFHIFSWSSEPSPGATSWIWPCAGKNRNVWNNYQSQEASHCEVLRLRIYSVP